MLKFEIDTLDGLDEGVKPLYVEHNGKFRLKVEGLDPADELKEALKKERENSKIASSKLLEIEKAMQEREQSRLEEENEFEKLYRAEKEQRLKDAESLNSFKKQIANEKREHMASELASRLTRDTAKADALKRFALDYIVTTNDGIEIEGMTQAELSEKLKQDYPFLVDGNQSSGGGAGGGSQRPQNPVDVKKGNANELMRSAFATPK